MWPSWDKPLPYILCHNSSLKYPDNSTSSIYLRFSDAKTTTKCQKLTTWWWKAGSTQTHWCLRRGHHQPTTELCVRRSHTLGQPGLTLPLNICFAEIPQGIRSFLKHKPPEVSLLSPAINLSPLATLFQSIWSHCCVQHMNLLVFSNISLFIDNLNGNRKRWRNLQKGY